MFIKYNYYTKKQNQNITIQCFRVISKLQKIGTKWIYYVNAKYLEFYIFFLQHSIKRTSFLIPCRL